MGWLEEWNAHPECRNAMACEIRRYTDFIYWLGLLARDCTVTKA